MAYFVFLRDSFNSGTVPWRELLCVERINIVVLNYWERINIVVLHFCSKISLPLRGDKKNVLHASSIRHEQTAINKTLLFGDDGFSIIKIQYHNSLPDCFDLLLNCHVTATITRHWHPAHFQFQWRRFVIADLTVFLLPETFTRPGIWHFSADTDFSTGFS